jgi:serine/threonine protein kinase
MRRPLIGQTVATYRIVDLVGEGGMGVVYRAEDQRLGRTVALKFLTPSLTRDENARARFLNEARAASALDHRNVCLIHDIAETADGQLYIIMPFYKGESLQRRIRHGAIPPGETVEILLQVCAGLAKAHDKGILHRDLKPANVMVTEDAEVKVLDFGCAKLSDTAQLTRTGSVVGTLAYMAPEQLREEGVDARTEIWSIGVMAYEMLTGDRPFEGETQAAVVTAILHRAADLEALRRAGGPLLSEVIRRCLRRSPQDRYPTVAALAHELARVRRSLLAAAGTEYGSEVRQQDEPSPTQAFLTPANRSALRPVEGEREASSATGTQLSRSGPLVVARDQELATLEAWLASAAEGRGRVGLIRGEEGRGKSTLVGEMCRRAAANGRFVFAIGSCNAQSGAGDPYLPFRELLSQLAGVLLAQETAGLETRAHVRRVQGLAPFVASAIVARGPHLVGTFVSGDELLEHGRELDEPGAEWIGRLEGIVASGVTQTGRRDPERAELFDEYARVVQRIAEHQPLLLVVEDLHWADGGSAALFGHLAKYVGAAPVLLLGTYRHEEITAVPGRERHPFEPVVHELTRVFGDIEIDLDKGDGERFVEALIDAEPNRLGQDFRERLLRCTNGLPLFTTELLRELRDGGVVARDEEGKWALTGAVDWDVLPRRVEAVVAERVGRLPDALRSLLTAASVQGEEASAEFVARVLGLDERETVRQLSSEAARRYRIVTAAGVRHVAGQRQSIYRFRHAQFQKYLYESLDEVERSVLHEDTAREMEAMYAGREDEVVAQLAHHYRRARILDKAIDYLERAAIRAAHMSAHEESIRLYQAALAELAHTPSGRERMLRELALTMELAAVQIAVHGFGSPPVEASYLRARELCEKLPEASDFPLLWGLFAFSAVRGEFDRSLPLARRMLEACEGTGDSLRQIQSHYAVGVTEFFVGHLQPALEHLIAASSPRQPELGQQLSLLYSQDSRKVAAAYASWVRWLQGDAEAALAGARAAVQWARQDPHPFTLSTVLLLTGFVHILAGDGKTAADHGEEMARLSREFSLFQTAEAQLVQALAGLARSAADEQAAARLAGPLVEYRQRQWTVFVPFLLGLLARARSEAGQESEAASLLAEAWSVAEAGGERFWAAELLRLRSDLASSPEAAAATASRALALAREQGAGWLELRAALAVARRGGDTAPLAEVVARFPADIEFADLRAARELLAK